MPLFVPSSANCTTDEVYYIDDVACFTCSVRTERALWNYYVDSTNTSYIMGIEKIVRTGYGRSSSEWLFSEISICRPPERVFFLETYFHQVNCPSSGVQRCEGTVDIAFAIDSNKTEPEALNHIRNFSKSVVGHFSLEKKANFALVNYNHDVLLELSGNRSAINHAFDTMGPSVSSQHGMDYAIVAAFAALTSSSRVVVPKLLFLFVSNDPVDPDAVLSSAERLKETGASIYIVGIGSVNETLMRSIATSDSNDLQSHYFHADSFDSLTELVNHLVAAGCKGDVCQIDVLIEP